jgi:hypothetical protein
MSMEKGTGRYGLRRCAALSVCRLSPTRLGDVLQLPLYTVWITGTRKQQAFAVVHCTVGDANDRRPSSSGRAGFVRTRAVAER